MKKLTLLLIFLLLLPTAGAWDIKFDGSGARGGYLIDAVVVDDYIYTVGVDLGKHEWEGNVSVFKLSLDGKLLSGYLIEGAFCDEDSIAFIHVDEINGSVVVGGTSCHRRFRDINAWILALDENGSYLWGLSFPGTLDDLKTWNGSVFVALTNGTGSVVAEIRNGHIRRTYMLRGLITTSLEVSNGTLFLAGKGPGFKAWVGKLEMNGSLTLWKMSLTAWDGPSVRVLPLGERLLVSVANSTGFSLTMLENGSAVFIEGMYSLVLTTLNGNPVVGAFKKYHPDSVLIELDRNGNIKRAHRVDFRVIFIHDGFIGGSMNGSYYLRTLPEEWGEPVNLTMVPINVTVTRELINATPVNLTASPFRPEIRIIDYRAHLAVLTEPSNASVYVDDTYAGLTLLNLTLHPGTYVIRITAEGYRDYTEEVSLKPGENFSLFAKLIPLPGYITVNSTPPGARVYVDGNYVGRTPITDYRLSPGEHEVEVRLRDYEAYRTTVVVGAAERVEVNARLRPLPGRLFINSTPTNLTATVIGGNLSKNCTTPCSFSLPPERYLVNVTDGKNWNVTEVEVRANSTSTVSLGLQPPKKESEIPILPALILLLAIGGAGAYLYLRRAEGEKGEKVTMTEKAIEVKAGKAFGISHVGNRDNNEDNLLVMRLPDAYLLAVADGLGGHNAGEVASQMAVDSLREVFEGEYRRGMDDEKVKALLRKAHELAHRRIKENAVGEREGMGTTLVSAFVRNGKAIIANTGDSRAHLIRDGKIVERTKDHSLVQELVDKGEITPEEAKRHPMRNIITKALGIDFGVDFYEWELKPGDVLLLSSDGLHDYVDEERIVEIASHGGSAEEIVRRLIEEALPVTRDNVTVVVWK